MKCGRINLGLTWKTAKRIDKYCPCWRGQRNRCIQLLSDRLFARSSLWFTENPEESLVSHELTSEVHLIKAKLSGRDYISHSLKCKSNEVITVFLMADVKHSTPVTLWRSIGVENQRNLLKSLNEDLNTYLCGYINIWGKKLALIALNEHL